MTFYLQHEDRVTSAGSFIGQGLGPGAVLPRLLDDHLDLIFVGHFFHLEVGHVDVSSLGIAHFDLMLEVWIVLKKISDLFVVNL